MKSASIYNDESLLYQYYLFNISIFQVLKIKAKN